MALHGEIKVNNIEIGSWWARRTDDVVIPNGVYEYECGARLLTEGREVRFMHMHCYADGAFRLAADVQSRAAAMLAGVTPRG